MFAKANTRREGHSKKRENQLGNWFKTLLEHWQASFFGMKPVFFYPLSLLGLGFFPEPLMSAAEIPKKVWKEEGY